MLNQLTIQICVLITCACFANAMPDWKREIGPTKPGSHPTLPPGKLEYTLSWKGLLNSGKLSFEIGKPGAHKPGIMVIKSTGKSMGPGGAIFPYNGHGWSEINVGNLRPRLATVDEGKRGKHIRTEIRFSQEKVIFREITKHKKGQEIESHVFAQSPVYDIGSAILFIRSQTLSKGDEINLMMHPYSSPYLLKSTVLGREKRKGTNTIKLSLELFKIHPKDMTLKPYEKMKAPAELWFSDDELRVPIEIRSKIFIGDVRATLKNFKKL